VELDKLKFEPFRTDTRKVDTFDCGNKSLNDFLCSEEVYEYERSRLGKTTLVFHDGALVAYYTLSNSSLRMEYLKKVKSFSKASEWHLREIPSLTIGRLAVDKRWKNRGIGETIVQKIVAEALDHFCHAGLRLVIVQAKKEAFGFYEKLGFQFVEETGNELKLLRMHGTRTMFLDLHKVE